MKKQEKPQKTRGKKKLALKDLLRAVHEWKESIERVRKVGRQKSFASYWKSERT